MTRKLLNITIFIYLLNFCFAQIETDSVSIFPSLFQNQNSFKTSFSKQINTYDLVTKGNYSFKFDQFTFGISNKFNSTLIKTSSKSIKDENTFSTFLNYAYSPELSFGVLLNSFSFEDDRNISINNTSNLENIFYSSYSPDKNIFLTPYFGYSSNELVGIKDNGFLYGTEFITDHILVDNFDIYGKLKFQNEDILPRRNIVRLANIELKNQAENLTNSLQAFYNQNGKDFYIATDSLIISEFDVEKNIQNRNEQQYFVSDQFRYFPVNSNFKFDVGANLSFREVSKTNKYYLDFSDADNNFDTRLEEFGLNFNLSTYYNSHKFNSLLKLSFTEKEEKYSVISGKDYLYDILEERKELEAKKNNKSQIVTLSLIASHSFSESDHLSFSSFVRKLKYDTGSELNYDDRDELLSIFRLMYVRKINPFLSAFVNLEGSMNHLVYIFAERSANNNKRRILKLATGTDYKGKKLSSKNSFEVSANYTTYDFEDLVPNFRSYSFRQFVAKDSTSFRLSSKVHTSLFGKLKLSEQGDFSWNDFSSKPQRFIKELFLEPKVHLSINKFKFAVGLKYFLLNTYSYNKSVKTISTSYESIGPLAELIIKSGENLYFRFIGWYEFITRENSNSTQLVNMNLELNWIL